MSITENNTARTVNLFVNRVCDIAILTSSSLSMSTQQYTRETMWSFSHTIGEDGSPVLQIHVEVHTPVLGLLSVVANGQTAGAKSSGSIVPGDWGQ